MSNNIYMTLWELLQDRSIEIPIIQRDYAQGRKGKESLRNRFLRSLKGALDSKNGLELDFVYGSIEGDKFFPLDGQQRLTTLWLLHWYVALRAGSLNEDSCRVLRRFTYETRVSSREFCERLCDPNNFKIASDIVDITDYITDSTWFYSQWKQDPTIQAMLTMIKGTKVTNKHNEDIVDGLVELFNGCGVDDFKEYWKRLTEQKIIGFSYLHLKDFGLSDDLYIKMNARGKALSPFENFKADLIGYIRDRSDDEEQRGVSDIDNPWKGLLSSKDGIPKKLDTTWMNIFWQQKDRAQECEMYRVDEIYYAFLNRFVWSELFTAKVASTGEHLLKVGESKVGGETISAESLNESYNYLNADDYNAYYDFKPYRYSGGDIPIESFKRLEKILDGYKSYIDVCRDSSKEEVVGLPTCAWDADFSFIPKYKYSKEEKRLGVVSINLIQRIIFFAVCKFFNDVDSQAPFTHKTITALKRWMRVVWNLVSANDISGRSNLRNMQAIRTAVTLVESLDSQDIYGGLLRIDPAGLGNSELDCRLKEEIIKCERINKYPAWERYIIEAEKSLFFKGGIRFLYHDESDRVDWSRFFQKLAKAKELFDCDGIKGDRCIEVVRSFVIQNDIEYIRDRELFNGKKETWNWILNNAIYSQSVHNLLMDVKMKAVANKDYHLPPFEDWPFDFMVKDEMFDSKGRFRWANDVLAFYKPNGRNALLLDQKNAKKNFERNKILAELCSRAEWTTSHRIEGTDLFYGWKIVFTYKPNSRLFVWDAKNEIYLANENGESVGNAIYVNPTMADLDSLISVLVPQSTLE